MSFETQYDTAGRALMAAVLHEAVARKLDIASVNEANLLEAMSLVAFLRDGAERHITTDDDPTIPMLITAGDKPACAALIPMLDPDVRVRKAMAKQIPGIIAAQEGLTTAAAFAHEAWIVEVKADASDPAILAEYRKVIPSEDDRRQSVLTIRAATKDIEVSVMFKIKEAKPRSLSEEPRVNIISVGNKVTIGGMTPIWPQGGEKVDAAFAYEAM